MPKDWDEGNKRIEGIFGQIGLGNQDPETIANFIEEYEKAMNTIFGRFHKTMRSS